MVITVVSIEDTDEGGQCEPMIYAGDRVDELVKHFKLRDVRELSTISSGRGVWGYHDEECSDPNGWGRTFQITIRLDKLREEIV